MLFLAVRSRSDTVLPHLGNLHGTVAPCLACVMLTFVDINTCFA